MNQRIRALARQAGWYIVDDDEQSTYFGNFAERFAELVVSECSRITDDWVNNEDNGKNYPSDKIKQHFGVER